MAMDYAKWFYSGKQWRKTRVLYLKSQHYICERCGGSACIVHHIEHITPLNITDLNITLSWNNLKAVCQVCHNAEHGNSACADGISFDGDGNLVYTPLSKENS
jgi:5-methylcytosine-specific restriction endonuclease McrA